MTGRAQQQGLSGGIHAGKCFGSGRDPDSIWPEKGKKMRKLKIFKSSLVGRGFSYSSKKLLQELECKF